MTRPLTFQEIEAFRAVVVLGTTVAAAKMLHTTQPTISRLIGQGQLATGLKLFTNDRGRLKLTREGTHLFEIIKSTFKSMEQIETAVSTLRESGAGVFRIASTPALGQSVLPLAMEKFAVKFPQVSFNVQTLGSREIEEGLRIGLYDIALTNKVYEGAEFDVEKIHESKAVCVSGVHHRFSALKTVRLQDLIGENFISLSHDDPLVRQFRERADKQGVLIKTSIETIYSSTICTFASRGLGVGVINPYMASVFLDRLCVRPFSPDIPVTTYVAFAKFSPISELAADFYDVLKEVCNRIEP